MMMESLLLPGCPGAVTTSDGLREPRLLPPGDTAPALSSASFFIANCGTFIAVVFVVIVCDVVANVGNEIVVTYSLNGVASFIVRVG